ncbi:YtxH domain-containing protein [Oceanihabitans sp. 2_MG-2023]|uniref:YtxH domain-containing protein n=1 Tax=Oceanihabitans sp. 2_MG-2023 TaxID=3062661 RepID=UPI0026E3DBF7|nr:YtxH domain-containing protein [Oceanihabitans sp. 2_MG-2023]MDO6596516.1 YtxH domain-containing protein [Oceanihabitans sp. 2_MG-2023]
MSDDKNLSDDLDDMIGSAKEGAKKAADKAEDFADDAKEAAKDFANDAKEVLSDGKNVAIIAHFWWIGWIIALIMNSGEKKSEYGSFYIRQMLGLLILSLASYVLNFVSVFVGGIFGIVLLVLWIMSLIGALSGEKKPTPVVGAMFQDWFKSL